MNKKQREKLLDGLMGLAYSYGAIAGGISYFEGNLSGWVQIIFVIILMFFISKQYDKE